MQLFICWLPANDEFIYICLFCFFFFLHGWYARKSYKKNRRLMKMISWSFNTCTFPGSWMHTINPSTCSPLSHVLLALCFVHVCEKPTLSSVTCSCMGETYIWCTLSSVTCVILICMSWLILYVHYITSLPHTPILPCRLNKSQEVITTLNGVLEHVYG